MSLSQRLILSSSSPRRQELLKALGYGFEVKVYPTDETFPKEFSPAQAVLYIAEQKAIAFPETELRESIVITADTIVCLNGEIMGKPANYEEAVSMLRKLSGQTHQVMTAVCLRTDQNLVSFSDTTDVTFRHLTDSEIAHYVTTCQPFDKAGAYGIQEWIGMIGVTELRGSYFNVMGLPVHLIYQHLKGLSKSK